MIIQDKHPDIARFYETYEDGDRYHTFIYTNGSSKKFEIETDIWGVDRRTIKYTNGYSIIIAISELERYEALEKQIKIEEEQKLKAIEERKQQQLIVEEKRKALQAEQEAIAKQASAPKITDQIVHQLKELHALKEAGILTEDEFNAKKKLMLGL